MRPPTSSGEDSVRLGSGFVHSRAPSFARSAATSPFFEPLRTRIVT